MPALCTLSVENPAEHSFSPSESFGPEADDTGKVMVVTCPETRLCGSAAERFANATAARCRSAAEVVIDLTSVTTIDAVGLRTLVRLARTCRAAGGELRLCSPSRGVRTLLAAAGLQQLAEILSTRGRATPTACPA